MMFFAKLLASRSSGVREVCLQIPLRKASHCVESARVAQSRATILLDGVPLNTPFGAWVYWDRVPRLSVESVEVVSGAASDLYGSGALGGVVNIITKPLRKSFATVEASQGNENTSAVSLDTGVVKDNWGISVALQAIRTNGYILIPRDQRGSVDTAAGTRDLSGALRVSRKLGEAGSFFIRASSFGESRLNGTPLQTNNTRIASVDLGIDWTKAKEGYFSFRIYGSDELFNQNFSSIAANRNSESLTNRQRNPSQQLGFAGQWRHTFSGKQTIVAGFEGRDVRGHSAETTFNSSRPTANVDAGGRQRALGFFGQDTVQFKKSWSLTLSARADNWLNSRGFSNRNPLTGGTPTASLFPDRSETAVSPRVSLLHTFKNIAVSASSPNLITRQRQNLGRIRARGVEVAAQVQLSKRLQLAGEYLMTESTVTRFPANPTLEGLRVTQIPKNQINIQLSYVSHTWRVGLQGRFVGNQFEDDQNILPLARLFTLDGEISRRILRHLRVFAAAQNLTGVRYQTGRTPIITVGPPVLARMGIHLRLPVKLSQQRGVHPNSKWPIRGQKKQDATYTRW